MFRSVLVPLDGSTFSEHALAWARPIARKAEAEVTLALVQATLSRYPVEMAVLALDEWQKALQQRELEYLSRRSESLRSDGIAVHSALLEGDVADSLIEWAEGHADLVVMATHGRGGVERAWLGSVADSVVRHVSVPVLLVRPESGEATPPDARLRHVLAATDGTDAAEAAVDHAAALARLFDARLTVLRVVSVPSGLASPYIPHAAEMDRDVSREREREAEEGLAATRSRLPPEVNTRVQLVKAYHPARGILTAIRDLDCDLVAVGTHRRSAVARAVLGSVADKVVRASPVPVLVGHDGRRAETESAAA